MTHCVKGRSSGVQPGKLKCGHDRSQVKWGRCDKCWRERRKRQRAERKKRIDALPFYLKPE